VRRAALFITLILVGAGCGVPASPAKQAEDLGSIAAEAALLAGDAAEGDTTTQFAATHAEALRRNAETLAAAITHAELGQAAADVVTALERLESAPGERGVAGEAKELLESAATRAEQIAKETS
jgi:GAF domain-containing protein